MTSQSLYGYMGGLKLKKPGKTRARLDPFCLHAHERCRHKQSTQMRGLGLKMPGRLTRRISAALAHALLHKQPDSCSPIPCVAEEQFVDALIARKEKAL